MGKLKCFRISFLFVLKMLHLFGVIYTNLIYTSMASSTDGDWHGRFLEGSGMVSDMFTEFSKIHTDRYRYCMCLRRCWFQRLFFLLRGDMN